MNEHQMKYCILVAVGPMPSRAKLDNFFAGSLPERSGIFFLFFWMFQLLWNAIRDVAFMDLIYLHVQALKRTRHLHRFAQIVFLRKVSTAPSAV